MNKKILIGAFVCTASLFLSPKMYSQSNLIIRFNDGNEKSALLSSMNTLTFSNSYLFMNYNDGSNESYALSGINKIVFGIPSLVQETSFLSQDYSLYPNPAQDFITITGTDIENCKAAIFSIDGMLVKSVDISSVEQQIDIQDLRKGFYLFVLKNKALKFTKR